MSRIELLYMPATGCASIERVQFMCPGEKTPFTEKSANRTVSVRASARYLVEMHRVT